jgi:hypothetical protein
MRIQFDITMERRTSATTAGRTMGRKAGAGHDRVEPVGRSVHPWAGRGESGSNEYFVPLLFVSALA